MYVRGYGLWPSYESKVGYFAGSRSEEHMGFVWVVRRFLIYAPLWRGAKVSLFTAPSENCD